MTRNETSAARSDPRPGRRRAGRPRASADPEQARRRIVESAAALFAEKGFGRTTTAEIAGAAGLSEGTVFHHFATKRALLAEVGEREGDRVLSIGLAGIDPAAPPPDPQRLLRPLFEYARQQPDAYRLFAMDGDVEDLASGFAAKRGRVTAGLAALLAAWSARGQLRAMNAELVADLVFAVADGAVRRMVLEQRWDEQEECLQEACHAVRGILAPLGAPAEEGVTGGDS